MQHGTQLTLFALPRELRDMIYDFSLNVGRVFPYYWASGVAKGSFPSVALLRVCKTVHQEAEPVLYRNTFVFSRYQAIEEFVNICTNTGKRKLFLQSIEIGLFYDSIDARKALHEAQMMTIDADIQDLPDNAPFSRCCRFLHHLTKSFTRTDHWQRTVSLVLDHLQPNRLIVDLSECYCNSGCCAMQMTAIECFSRGFAAATPRVVKLVGLVGFDDTSEHTIADDFALELLQLWTSKRAGRAGPRMDERLLPDGDFGLIEDVRLELESNGNW